MKTSAILGGGLLLVLASTARAQDRCDCGEVLRNQYPAVLASQTHVSLASDVWNYFCSDAFESQQRGAQSNAEAIIPLDGIPVPFKGGSSYDESWRKRTRACSAGRNQFSNEQAAQVFFSLVPENIQLGAQQAWLECKKRCGGASQLVRLEYSRIGDRGVSFTLSIDPAAVVAYVTDIIPDNLECRATNIRRLAQITAQGIGERCDIRDTTRQASLTVIPSYGAPVYQTIVPPERRTVVTIPPPHASSAGVESVSWEGDFGCGSGMSCQNGRVLAGVTDGTGCGVVDKGLCGTVAVRDQDGRPFSGPHTENCVSLDQYGCGGSAECPNGKVLIAFSDGTGCGVPNGGQCCDLVGQSYRLLPDIRTCAWGSGFACGNSGSCPSNEVMTAIKDGTGCGVPNQIKCCGLAVQ